MATVKINWRQYNPGSAFDELIKGGGRARPHARQVTR